MGENVPILPAYNKLSKNVSNTSSWLWPNAILLQPSLIATELITPLLKFAHKEHGFFSFLISKTISLAWLSSINNGICKLLHIFCKNDVSKYSNPGLTLIAIISNFLG